MNIFSSKINITKISSFFSDVAYKNKVDRLTFIYLPFTISISLFFVFEQFPNSLISNLITILSILIGLFFSVLIFILSLNKLTDRVADEGQDLTFALRRRKFLKEITIIITYSVLIGLLIIGISFFTLINLNFFPIDLLASFSIYFFISHYFMIILVILKRTFALVRLILDF